MTSNPNFICPLDPKKLLMYMKYKLFKNIN